MTSRSKTRLEPPPHLVRSTSWSGLSPGDPVEVLLGAHSTGTWTFLAHVRNERSGEEFVEVLGGRRGERSLRCFRPERVYPPGGLRRKELSLAQAPRLPLR